MQLLQVMQPASTLFEETLVWPYLETELLKIGCRQHENCVTMWSTCCQYVLDSNLSQRQKLPRLSSKSATWVLLHLLVTWVSTMFFLRWHSKTHKNLGNGPAGILRYQSMGERGTIVRFQNSNKPSFGAESFTISSIDRGGLRTLLPKR